MNIKLITKAFAAALLVSWMGFAHAVSVTLTADNSSVLVGDTVTFTYSMDFSDDSTLGGGTDFFYDNTVLQFVGWSFDTDLNSDNPFFRTDPRDCTQVADTGCDFDPDQFGAGLAQLNGLAWGQDSGTGMAGPEVIGQMVFEAIGVGAATIFMAANDDGVPGDPNDPLDEGDPGPFVSGNTFTEQDVQFNHGSVTVTQIPLPGAVWLMLSAIGMLGGARRFA